MTKQITGNVVIIEERKIFYGTVEIENGIIQKIIESGKEDKQQPYILPGFIDSHVHIESSLLIPTEFARLAVVHGTVATISDPHEIANVCGMAGVEYMIRNSEKSPFHFHFGAPSCVPATVFETAGAAIDANDVEKLMALPGIYYLSEMMNFPGVLHKDPEVMNKISIAHASGKPVDGHAPGLSGENALTYISAGITTDHECFTFEEAHFKITNGMKILIREGSAAKNFDALIPLIKDFGEDIMFCSDDKHPDSLLEGHINALCRRAVSGSYDVFNVLMAACINPHKHYNMVSGRLRVGDPADLIVINNLQDFTVLETYLRGELAAREGKSLLQPVSEDVINNFNCKKKNPADFRIEASKGKKLLVIEALDGQLITNKIEAEPSVENNSLVSNIDKDILKIVVINRYHEAPVALAFIKNFGLKSGAIASSVAHDSHNIVVCGVSDEAICEAANLVIEQGGGLAAVSQNQKLVLPLPVAGIMSNKDGYAIAAEYTAIDKFVKEELKSSLASPFMTLSFMALLVIPHLKLSDKGLFDGDSFSFVD